MSVRNLAIIPARAGSKRLPGKNKRDFYGKPVYHYAVKKALESELFDLVVLSTDDCGMESGAKYEYERWANFLLHHRAPDLAGDGDRLPKAILAIVNELEETGTGKSPILYEPFKNLCVLYPTAPLMTAQDIAKSYILLLEHGADFCMGICEWEKSPWYAFEQVSGRLSRWRNYPPSHLKNKASENNLFRDNGSLYWANVEAFKRTGELEGPNTVGYMMPRWKSVDVNTQDDWDRLEWEAGRHGWKK